MTHPFGQSFTYWFYPLVDDNSASLPNSILAQSPIIYVFDDNVPSRSDAASGANAISTITAWAWNYQKKAWGFSVPAIPDPDPASNIDTREYWISLNFRLQPAGQVQTVLKPLQLERVVGHNKTVEVNEDDLKKYFPQVEAYSSQLQRVAYISQATEEVKASLRLRGYEWAKIQRADRLDLCVTYKALSMIMLAQIQEPNDKFSIKYIEFKQSYTNALDSLKFEYQEDEGGVTKELNTTGTILLQR